WARMNLRRATKHRTEEARRPRRAPAAPLDLNRDAVCGRHERARPQRELPDRKTGIIVHAVDFFDAEAVHQPILDHRLAAGAALLGRLENHDRSACEVARLGKILRGAEQHRGMTVVTAGMHLTRHRRLVRYLGGLLDRQRIHVGAQSDATSASLAPADHADNAGAPDSRHHLVAAEALELIGNRSRSAMHIVEKFGMSMDIVPPGTDLALHGGNAVDDRHRLTPHTTCGRTPTQNISPPGTLGQGKTRGRATRY